ncbi:MAG: hydrolase, partial [Solirubrobacterales bacterium]|nr:hydrolase [Solirubrobacterales bacterium]
MPRSTEPVLDALLEGIERELPRAIALRRRLHATPELAHAEQQTSASVAAELPVASVAVAGTGRIARVDPGAAPDDAGSRAAPVAVRAELDGLPLRERTGAPFAASG